MNRMDRVVVAANKLVIVAMMGLTAVLVFTNVVFRNAFDESVTWIEEVSRYSMIWMVFLGSGLLFRQGGGHIAVESLQDAVPARIGRIMRALVVAILMIFFLSMVAVGAQYTMFQWRQTTPVTQIPFGLVYAAMPIGFLLMIYHLSMVCVAWIRDKQVHPVVLEDDGEA